ncbi:MAG: DNA helicase RecQ [Bacteroidia bacterium]
MIEEIETNSLTLTEALQKYFGFSKFKGNQEAIIANLLEGRDTFVIMPTGGGKSLCYQLPALISEGTAIVVSPLIALMKNQVDAIRGFSAENGVAHFLNSSLNKGEIAQVKKDILSGKTKLLYVAPESLNKQENVEFLSDIKISFYAIDEAHCISEWGHDFRPEYRRLRPIMEQIGKRPVIALTATATPKVQQDIQKNLGMVDADVFKSSFNRENLYYEIRPKGENVVKDIIKYIRQHEGKSGIIYCLSRKKVEELAEFLQVNGIKALPYHAGLDAATRAKTQDQFLMEEIHVIVATIAFGMGIDKPDVRYVIHHDIPKSLEGYYQETGRAGRDGGEGNCITFYSYDDIEKLEKFLNGKPVAEQEIGKQLLQDVVAYAESSMCRRKMLLHYFGEEFDDKKCGGNCDNCRNPKPKFEAQEEILLLLQTILAVKEKFKAKHIVNVLLGQSSSAIKSYKHDELDVYGEGADQDERFWNTIIRHCLILGLITKDIENYGLLKVSKLGKEYLKKPYPIMVAKEQDFDKTNDDEDVSQPASGGGGTADEALFNMLKDLRKKVAKKENLPPYVIFQDTSLEEMATSYPITLDELKNISGVGAGKAAKFGKPFVDLIAKYVEENEIERPQDLVVKSPVNKSGLKVYIIQSIDRKVPLDAIAEAKGIEMDELLNEIESIVHSGTKVNIKYFIDEVIDEEKQEEIYEYIRETEHFDLDQALRDLGENDYLPEEIRLMHIKFMSEMGN